MKVKLHFRLISIGFITGILFSGILFLIINIFHIHQSQNSIQIVTPIIIGETTQNTLASSNGKIDINRAALNELDTLPGIGKTKANAIIEFREKYGAFESVSELSYVPGIGNTLLKSIEDLVIIR
jgi:competence protein ComEA